MMAYFVFTFVFLSARKEGKLNKKKKRKLWEMGSTGTLIRFFLPLSYTRLRRPVIMATLDLSWYSAGSGFFFFKKKGNFLINHKAIDYKIIFSPLTSDHRFCFCQKKSCILLPPLHLLLSFRGMAHLGFTPPTPASLSLSPKQIHIQMSPSKCTTFFWVSMCNKIISMNIYYDFLQGLMRFWLYNLSTLEFREWRQTTIKIKNDNYLKCLCIIVVLFILCYPLDNIILIFLIILSVI